MIREVRVKVQMSKHLTATFHENRDGVLVVQDAYNYEKGDVHDMLKLAMDCWDWIEEGKLP